MRSDSKIRKVANCALLIALAMVLSYVEALIPINFGIPGVKLGIPNLVIVVGLYLLKPHEVFIISMLRVILVAAMFGNGMSLMYSLAGGILSFAAMALLSRAKGFSMIGISILGGVCHNIGQIIVAAVAVENLKIMYYFPVLLIAGIVTGAVIGIISGRILKIAQKTFVNENKKVKDAQTKVNMDKSAGSVKRW